MAVFYHLKSISFLLFFYSRSDRTSIQCEGREKCCWTCTSGSAGTRLGLTISSCFQMERNYLRYMNRSTPLLQTVLQMFSSPGVLRRTATATWTKTAPLTCSAGPATATQRTGAVANTGKISIQIKIQN